MNKLGYSYSINERNSEKLYSLNKSIEELIQSNETLKKFESIEFELEGCFSENNLKLVVDYKTKCGKNGKEEFSSHVDQGAIELTESIIQANFGMDKFNEIKSDLDENYGIL